MLLLPSLVGSACTKAGGIDRKKEEKTVNSVKSPTAMKESLQILYDILIDAIDLIVECKQYLTYRDGSDASGYAYILRPNAPPEKVPLRIVRAISDIATANSMELGGVTDEHSQADTAQ